MTSLPPSRERLRLLKTIAETLNEASDINRAIHTVLSHIVHSLGLQTSWIFRYDPNRLFFVEMGAIGLPPALACHDAQPLKSGWCECQDRFIRERLHTAVNIVRCSRLGDAVGDTEGLVFHASVPLRSETKALGILNVASGGKKPFSEETLSLLRTIGYQAAVALDRSTLLLEHSRYAQRLRALAVLANQLIALLDTDEIFSAACQQLVEILGYDAIGIFHRQSPTKPFVAKMVQETPQEQGYSYDQVLTVPQKPEFERMLLANSVSGFWQDIPQTPYRIRVESRQNRATHPLDQDLLVTAAWHIAAALENVRAYRKSRENAQQQIKQLVASALHDSVNQRLFSAQLLTRSAAVTWQTEHNNPQIDEFLQRIRTQLAQSQAEMRRLIGTLRPPAAKEWIAQLKEDLSHWELSTGIYFQLNLPEELPNHWDQDALYILKGIIDESVHNALKHGDAHIISLTLSYDADSLTLIVQDDGKGFDPEHTKAGYGSQTTWERTAFLGGEISLETRMGRGTRVRVVVPLRTFARNTNIDQMRLQ